MQILPLSFTEHVDKQQLTVFLASATNVGTVLQVERWLYCMPRAVWVFYQQSHFLHSMILKPEDTGAVQNEKRTEHGTFSLPQEEYTQTTS